MQNEKGIETLKGGITLASKVMVEGYHYYERWDIRGTIRTAIRRGAFYLTKGVEEKENIIQSTDRRGGSAQKNLHVQNMNQLESR